MSMTQGLAERTPARSVARPRVGFLGVGWIGRHRMAGIAAADAVDIAAVCDPSPEMAAEARKVAAGAQTVGSLDDLLAAGIDALVIATPSALHAEQSIRALERGLAVFCQKPLGRTRGEVEAVIAAARAADRLLAVDFSYRFTEGMRRIREVVRSGELGSIYAVDLVFHNAYGPDKPWFYDRALAGGGCVMDLGVHLVDLALWLLDVPHVTNVASTLYADGKRLSPKPERVEDYALATLELDGGAVAQLACSWRLPAGCDAVISIAVYGTQGGAALRNVNGSFYDFVAERYRGTARETLATPPDEWGVRAGADWARRLAAGERFDPAIEGVAAVASVIDRIYGR